MNGVIVSSRETLNPLVVLRSKEQENKGPLSNQETNNIGC